GVILRVRSNIGIVQVTTAVNPVNMAPVVNAGPPQAVTLPNTVSLNGMVSDDGLPPGSTLTVSWRKLSGPGTVTFVNPNLAVTTASFSEAAPYVLRLTASDSLLSSDSDIAVTVSPVPPPPTSLVAPPLDQSVVTTLSKATEFLYTGPDAVQTGVAAGTINLIRAAAVRGKVTTRDGAALPGVKITILNHPEFGETLSRVDGMFDMAVNGGGSLT